MSTNNKETRQTELNRLRSIKELIKFAEKNAESHRRFYHYTTLDSLTKILETKTLWLSKGNKMNDLQEQTKGSFNIWNETFLSSFCFGTSESIAMWTMYGIPWNKGVRLSFSGSEFIDWVKGVREVRSVYQNTPDRIVSVKNIVVTDVMYTSYESSEKTEKIKLDSYNLIDTNNQFGEPNISRKDEITGYIKNRAWEFENETRVKVRVSSPSVTYDKVSIKLTDKLLASTEITLNPWIDLTEIHVFVN